MSTKTHSSNLPSSSGTDDERTIGVGNTNAAEKNAESQDMSDAPDGGATAWLVVLGAWCTSFCSFGWINSVGTFQQYYQTGPLSTYSPSAISWIPSLQIFFMMAMGPIVGKLYDQYGPRYLILGGTFLHVFGLMMASISDQYYQFLLSQGVCSAIGVAAIFQPALSVIPGWFDAKRGAAYGILSTGSSIGGVIFPIMLSRLVASVGYGWAMRISAFMILGLLIVANLTVRARLPPNPVALTRQQMIQPFQEKIFVCLMVGILLITFGIYIPITYLPVQAMAQGIRRDIVQYLIPFLNTASLFGRMGSGLFSDRFGKYNVFITSCLIAGIVSLALWIPSTSEGATIAFAVLYGFFSGAYVSLIGALVAPICPPKEIGFRTGLVFLTSSIPGLTTNPIAGAILEHTGSYDGLKIFAGVMILAGTSVIIFARISHTGFKLAAVF